MLSKKTNRPKKTLALSGENVSRKVSRFLLKAKISHSLFLAAYYTQNEENHVQLTKEEEDACSFASELTAEHTALQLNKAYDFQFQVIPTAY